MDFRDREEQSRPVGHILSSMIVRPSESGGSDYETGEVSRQDGSLRPKTKPGYGIHAGSASPLHQRRVDDHYELSAESISPLRKRKVDHRYGMRAGSISPLHRRKLDHHYRMSPGPISPLPQRKVDHHHGMRAGSVSPLHERNVVSHDRTCISSYSPLHHRNVDTYNRTHAGSLSPVHRRNVDNHYGMRAGSISPLHQRRADHNYDPGSAKKNYDPGLYHSAVPRRSRGFRRGMGLGRFQNISAPFGRGRGNKSFDRGFDGPGLETLPLRGEGIRNNPNVSPREGDWLCPNPSCGNVNFKWRPFCSKCNRLRLGPARAGPSGSPRGRYSGPPSPRGPWSRDPGPPLDFKPPRDVNGFGSPPQNWSRDGPRAQRMDPPPPRRGGRFPDHVQRARSNYPEHEFRERKVERLRPSDWTHKDHGGGEFFHEKRGYDARVERRPPSPPLLPYHDNWPHERRERSRSPIRVGPRNHRRGPYMGRDGDDRRPMVRGRGQGRY